MSYQNMNHFTHPFTFPISLFDDAVQDIDTEAKYFISVDMYSENWQVVVEEEARERLTFSTPGIDRQWKVMSMWDLN